MKEKGGGGEDECQYPYKMHMIIQQNNKHLPDLMGS